jgi:hypothetical protein
VPKPGSTLPTRGPTCPKTAVSAAIVKSQITCSTWPPPIAKPFTMAMTGFGMARMTPCRPCMSMPMPVPVPYPLAPRSRWSPPAENALSPAPVRTTTPTSGSAQAARKAAISSSTVVARKALRTSGRLIVIQATPSRAS